jgi:2-polyprenyl-3-methyl-5-hydroxy-6-metoxy-1,4-benzoquinol methylase
MSHFDWIFYVNYYYDLKTSGIATEDRAIEHYKSHGVIEKRKTCINVGKYITSGDTTGESLFCNVKCDGLSSVTQQFINYLIKSCHLMSNYKVIEIGCGIACLSLPVICSLGCGTYVGLDSDLKCIEWCRKNIEPHTHSVFDHIDSLENMGDNGTYDLIYSTSVFMTIPISQISNYLNRVHRLLKIGGQLVISVLIWNTTIQAYLRGKSINSRIVKIPSGSGYSYQIIGNYGERVYVHPDDVLNRCLESRGFTIKEVVFGNWTETSSDVFLCDLINLVKVR